MRKLIALFVLLATVSQVHAKPKHRTQKSNQQYQISFFNNLVERARADIGKTAKQLGLRRTLWCSAYMNLITGGGTGSDLADSWKKKKHVAPSVGVIALVRSRRHHVGVVSGFDANGNPIIISGNHGGIVAEGVYPKRSVIAYVSAN